MLKLLRFLSRQSRTYLIVLGFTLAALVGLVDYLTGSELVISIFYLVPIALVAWLVSKRAGILMSITCALLVLLADLLSGQAYFTPVIPYWNAAISLGLFLIVTYALAALRGAQDRQQELEQFVVHDLRSPLTNIMSGLQTMQDAEDKTLDETQKRLVEMCLISSNRMSTLIDSLLDLAYLDSGQMPLQCETVEVANLVEQSLLQVSVWARRNRVSLAQQLATEVETVYADRAVIIRVLVNLLSNAIKFSPPESVVTVQVAPADTGWAIFSVADQGRGIPQEWTDKVFDKFVQVEARRAGRTIGSGLGLTFCREAVEVHGGRIWLESEPRHGTTVTFTLPARAP